MVQAAIHHLDPIFVVTRADSILPELAREEYHDQYDSYTDTNAGKVRDPDLGVPQRQVFVMTPVLLDDKQHSFGKNQGAVLLLERLLAMAGFYCKTRQ